LRIVLSYSGGLDTTVAIAWLREKYKADVVTVTVDVGQPDDFSAIEKRAYAAGSSKHYTVDAKQEFAREFVSYAIKLNALYEGSYPLSTALARPLIAKKVVEVAKREEAEAIAHGSTSKGNDQVRFDLAIKALAPNVRILAPARVWGMTREEELSFAKAKGIPVTAEHAKYSIDENLWGRSIEGEDISDPSVVVPEDAFLWTKRLREGKLELLIEFKEGVPISVNGERMELSALIKYLNVLAGSYGFGRVDHVENRVVGFKSREVYEAPAALLLISSHIDLEKTVYTPLELRFKREIDSLWSDLVYRGLWFEPLRTVLERTANELNRWIEGEVKVEVEGPGLKILGRRSQFSGLSEEIASYNKGWYPTDEMARGFIEMWGLHSLHALRVRGM
jgi:argininosuccinate synthase